ncbi:MAG: hypothetical protein HC900_06060 [Methylacidiphilales bacterium]|nr:hypothetical protein [Candidatus Methylacidiphilales bacterium]
MKEIAATLVVVLGVGIAEEAAAQSQNARNKTKEAQSQSTAPDGGVPELLAKFSDWAAFVSQTPNTRICYALSQPKDRQPASLKRDPGYLFISHRPGEGVRNEVSAMVGFPLKEDDAELQVGNVMFVMTAKDDNVWIKNPAEEPRLIEAIRQGRDLTIKGTSRRGNKSTDRYSLKGASDALDRIAQECK